MRLCLDFHAFVNKQNEIETLKAENDRLKSSGNATPTATPIKTARPPSETSSTSSSSSRQSLGLSLNNLNITDTIMSGRFTVSSGVCVNQRQQPAVFLSDRWEQEVWERWKWSKQTWNKYFSQSFSQSGLSIQLFFTIRTSWFFFSFQNCWQVQLIRIKPPTVA